MRLLRLDLQDACGTMSTSIHRGPRVLQNRLLLFGDRNRRPPRRTLASTGRPATPSAGEARNRSTTGFYLMWYASVQEIE